MPTVEIVYVDDEMDTLEYGHVASGIAENTVSFSRVTHPFEAESFLVNMLHVRSITYYKEEVNGQEDPSL